MSSRFSRLRSAAARAAAGRLLWLWLLLVIALCYYGSYYRHGLNFKDEGGTVTLLAQRLLAGERPFTDLVLGYNVLWFYPVVALFKVGGVSFVNLRIYCFVLSTITALLGFLTVTRASRRPWLGFLAGLLLILIPGMTFKNYMPLLAVANACCLLHFALALGPEGTNRQAWLWLLTGGVVLGLTFLIRIDVGLFASVLWLGALVLAIAPWRWHGRSLAALLLGGPAALATLVIAVHLPVLLDAQRRGFAGPFLAQYTAWPVQMVQNIQQLLGSKPARVAPAPLPAAAAPAEKPAVPAAKKAKAGTGTLQRKGLSAAMSGKLEDRLLAVLLYLPLVSVGILVLWAIVRLIQAGRARNVVGYSTALGALVLLGAALTVFPQYFFFRPDSPHLSEFSPGFWVAVIGSVALLGQPASWLSRGLITLLVLHAGTYVWRMLPDRWTGTIWVRKDRSYRFRAENGVDVMVSRREIDALNELKSLVTTGAAPGQYVIAWPYQPSVNVLANRPTFEKNVYIDNATAEPRWNQQAIKRLEKLQPPVIVLSDWAINGTDESRFSVWAAETRAWIQQHYTRRWPAVTEADARRDWPPARDNFMEMELYVLDSLPAVVAPTPPAVPAAPAVVR